MKVPPFLKKGDKIGIVAPASSIDVDVSPSVEVLESWGLEVLCGKTVGSRWHQFSADDDGRAQDLQQMIDAPEIKAIIAARGGYGTVRIIDKLNFSALTANPKWIVGFSDITVLHAHLHARLKLASLHGQMPLNMLSASHASLLSLRQALFGTFSEITYQSTSNCRSGAGKGILIGGNLSILVSIIGSASDMDYNGKILFIEEVGEYYYAVDRMLYTLKRAGKLSGLKGLIIGAFSHMKDKAIPFGASIADTIMQVAGEYDFPVASGFPAGHIENNRALVLGKEVDLRVNRNRVTLKYT